MKNRYITKTLIALTISATTLISCSKSDGGSTPAPTPTPTPTPEATIAFSIDIDPGSGNIYAATGATQAISVNVSSKLPTSGVQIDVKTTVDADNSSVSSSSVSSSTANTAVNVDGLKSGVLCTTTVTVTSKTTATNTTTKTFKIARK